MSWANGFKPSHAEQLLIVFIQSNPAKSCKGTEYDFGMTSVRVRYEF